MPRLRSYEAEAAGLSYAQPADRPEPSVQVAETAEGAPAAKRGRGRPPKHKPAATQAPANPTALPDLDAEPPRNNDPGDQLLEPADTPAVPKRGRGRPPKKKRGHKQAAAKSPISELGSKDINVGKYQSSSYVIT